MYSILVHDNGLAWETEGTMVMELERFSEWRRCGSITRGRRPWPPPCRPVKEYILPARFDATEVPGIRPTIGYVNLVEKTSSWRP